MRASPYGHPLAASTSGTVVKYQVLLASLVFADYVATSNMSLTAASTTLDGATVAEGKLVALVGQSTASENGLYVADSVSGSTMALARVPGFQVGDKMAPGEGFRVGSGTAGAGKIYRLSASAEATIGTDSLSFEVDKSNQKTLPLPVIGVIDLANGAVLAAFSNGASSVPGTAIIDSKSAGIRWNNHATPAAIAFTQPMPQDLDDTQVVTYHALVSKSGATVGDALSLDVAAFEVVPGALHDADSDMGGTTSAVTGNATAKTVTEVILTLTAANIHAAPEAISFQVKPTAGTLGTDDAFLHAHWLEYTPKALTS